jgi:hypothetical protein
MGEIHKVFQVMYLLLKNIFPIRVMYNMQYINHILHIMMQVNLVHQN